MFELSIALKYLIPRWRQLSVSIISLVSTLVIALVVWLIVVFFSVKEGLENSWIEKIVALTAPVRITPTPDYYHSYYYLSDTLSAASSYSTKTIGEKLSSPLADAYDPTIDEELPSDWPAPDLNSKNEVKDLVKEAFAAAKGSGNVKGLSIGDFETTAATLNLTLLRKGLKEDDDRREMLEHASIIGSFDPAAASLRKALLEPSPQDIRNLLLMQGEPLASSTLKKSDSLSNNLKAFFSTVDIDSLRVPPQGWRLPLNLLPVSQVVLEGYAAYQDQAIARIVVPTDATQSTLMAQAIKEGKSTLKPVRIAIEKGTIEQLTDDGMHKPVGSWVPLIAMGPLTLTSEVIESSLTKAKAPTSVRFHIKGTLQGHPLSGTVPLGSLEISSARLTKESTSPIAARVASQTTGIIMPSANSNGEPLLVPKGFREGGVLLGDRGYLAYYSPTPSAMQEQRIPVYVAGFYDPGIIPIGGKFLLAGKSLTALIRASYGQEETQFSNGINVHFNSLADAAKVKAAIQKNLDAAGIARYWQVESYHEYPFTKDIIQQLQSEKNLFSLISLVIIIVACSNIISMLIILVNDKKLEIGILRSMGASSASIAAIFGICGIIMGTMGSLIGIVAAIATLKNVNELVAFLSHLQGHDLFNPIFYGNTLPTELSFDALLFVMITTAAISLLAGIVPAVKASLMRPSAILRAE